MDAITLSFFRYARSLRCAWLSLFILFVAPALADESRFRIDFGSCLNQAIAAPILDRIVEHQPDAMLLLGDNIYSTTNNLDDMRRSYEMLTARSAFQMLRDHATLLS